MNFAEAEVLPLGLVESLLDELPRAPFCIKDQHLRYQSVNAAMLEICGVESRAELIGKTARDFFPDSGKNRYEVLDRQVMRTQTPVRDRLEFCQRNRGNPVWLLTNRWPVIANENQPIGVASISRVLDAPDRRHPIYERLEAVIEHLRANFAAPVDISDLARRAGVSVSQLERDFVQLLGLPPRRYLIKVRFEAALELLKAGGSIAEVAHACGYSDQSAFTRRFRAAVGVSPSEYRRTSLTAS